MCLCGRGWVKQTRNERKQVTIDLLSGLAGWVESVSEVESSVRVGSEVSIWPL